MGTSKIGKIVNLQTSRFIQWMKLFLLEIYVPESLVEVRGVHVETYNHLGCQYIIFSHQLKR